MIEWMYEIPQEPGEYMYIDIDLGGCDVTAVTICAAASYRPDLLEEVRKSKGVYIYRSNAGTELVMCFPPSHIAAKPYIDEHGPEVWAWAKLNLPERHMRGPYKLTGRLAPEATPEQIAKLLKNAKKDN